MGCPAVTIMRYNQSDDNEKYDNDDKREPNNQNTYDLAMFRQDRKHHKNVNMIMTMIVVVWLIKAIPHSSPLLTAVNMVNSHG